MTAPGDNAPEAPRPDSEALRHAKGILETVYRMHVHGLMPARVRDIGFRFDYWERPNVLRYMRILERKDILARHGERSDTRWSITEYGLVVARTVLASRLDEIHEHEARLRARLPACVRRED